mgnify:FL=1|tara:strand:+ start:708 stop:866 length:159 start_codon:yes stop_codon:yes gene_type:complete
MLEEIYYLVRHARFSHSDILKMPVFERRFYVEKLLEEFRKRQEQAEKAKNKS